MADTGSTWATIIPEFYYDLIARIVPGLLLTGLLVIVFGSDVIDFFKTLASQGHLGGVPFALLFVIAIAVSYAIGILLGPFGAWLRALYMRSVWKDVAEQHADFVQRCLVRYRLISSSAPAPDVAIASLESSAFRTLYRVLEDELKGRDPQARLLLPKLHAETVFCEHLAAGLYLMAAALGGLNLAHGLCATQLPTRSWFVIAFTFASAIVTTWVARYRFWELIQRLLSLGRHHRLGEVGSSVNGRGDR